jgi:4-aminobutyrate aminotransferase/(S)-3-amino-2-methylpropionate transaminase
MIQGTTPMNSKELYHEYMITSMVAGFEPVDVERAAGCTMTDKSGQNYLDCFSGIAVTNAGHGHPRIIAAAKAQMDKLVHCCTYVYYNPVAAELAKRLAEVTPGRLQKSFFGSGGAEAIEGAMRIAKQFTKCKELVCLTMGFHGRSVGTLSITGNRGCKKGAGPYQSGIAFSPAPYCYRCPFKLKYPSCGCACAEFMDHVLKYQTSGDVAAFIAEPVMGEGGILVPPPEYLKVATDHIRKEGALYIADEVQCGYGRTGKLFAVEHFGVEPDIMCMAKGIASGFPLSAFIVRSEIANAFTPGDHLSTFGGNPVSCAAGIATLDVMRDEELPGAAAIRGAQFMARLRAFQEKCPMVGDVRGLGLMIGVELVKDVAKTPAAAEAKRVRELCREAGVLVGVGGVMGNVIRIQPPLVITAAEVDRACDVLENVIRQVTFP